jgi:hypothetical protein
MAIVCAPTVAVIGAIVVEKVPPSLEYSKLQVPVPPPLSTGLIRVKTPPAHTVVVAGDCVAVGATGSATTVQEYVVAPDAPQLEPLQFFRMAMVCVPNDAVMGVSVVENAPPSLEYSKLQVPAPPPLSTGLVSVSVLPTQTVVVAGDCVAVGTAGSLTTVQEYVLVAEDPQPEPVQLFLIAIV